MPIQRLAGAVVYAMDDGDMYLALVHDIFGHWTLSKGKIEEGETVEAGAVRELKEEIGYGARKLTFLKTITLAPGYQSNATHIVLAEDLYEESAEGDEPEPLEIVPHKLSELETLTYNEDLTEARSILALYMAREIIRGR